MRSRVNFKVDRRIARRCRLRITLAECSCLIYRCLRRYAASCTVPHSNATQIDWHTSVRRNTVDHICENLLEEEQGQGQFSAFLSESMVGITTSGFLKQTAAILEFYFGFNFDLCRIIGIRSASAYQISSESNHPRRSLKSRNEFVVEQQFLPSYFYLQYHTLSKLMFKVILWYV